MKKVLSAFLFISMFGSGFAFFHFFKFGGEKTLRDPAAIGGSFDLTSFEGEDLAFALKERVLKGLDHHKTPDTISVSLSNFIFLNSQGQRKFACDEFQQVSIQFVAEGVAVAGEKPSLQIRGACVNSGDLARLGALILPLEAFGMNAPHDGEFQLSEPVPVEVTLKNMPDVWPKTWVLDTVSLVKTKGESAFIIEQSEINQILGRPYVLTF